LKALSGMSIDSQMAEVARIEMLLAEEENKRAKWKTENIRRRQNYLPLIMELLRYIMKSF
jgi:ubiquitin carboxyl-terminal hydrolase L5